MRENFDKAFDAVLKHEGGYSAHPMDPGGMTNLGVTRNVWQHWVGGKVTEAEMRALTPEDVKPLYYANFWRAIRGDDLPSGVDYAVFDAAVNSGPVRAIRWAQAVAGAEQDGKMGPKTVAAIKEIRPEDFIDDYCTRRLSFLQRLPIWKVFGKGWRNRVADVRLTATTIALKGSG